MPIVTAWSIRITEDRCRMTVTIDLPRMITATERMSLEEQVQAALELRTRPSNNEDEPRE